MRSLIIGAGVALLAACGGAAEPNDAVSATGSAQPALDETQRRVVAMSDNERNAVMIRAIRAARQECQGVDRSEAVPDTGASPTYIATCGRNRYIVTIGPNGAGSVAVPTAEQGR